LTINSLLHHSLANLQRKSASLVQQKARPSQERSYGFWAVLIAARLQEAELLISGYVRGLGNTATGDADSLSGGWAFHR
jgi:hypothetical protein